MTDREKLDAKYAEEKKQKRKDNIKTILTALGTAVLVVLTKGRFKGKA